MGLSTFLGLPLAEKIVSIVEKFIPLTADQRTKLQLELAKESTENLKVKTEYVKSLGIIIRDAIIPSMLFFYTLFHVVNFFTAWWYSITGREPFTIPVDSDYKGVINTLIGFLFTYKGSTYIADVVTKNKEGK